MEQNKGELFRKYLENKCTPEESDQVLEWLAAENYGPEQQEAIHRFLQNNAEINSPALEELKQRLRTNFEIISQKIEEKENGNAKIKQMSWWRLAAAAVLLIAIGGGVFYFLQAKTGVQNTIVQKKSSPAKNDLAPGGNKAILTLGDGKQVILEEAQNGDLAQQGSTTIIKTGDRLSYKQSGKFDEVVYNTITTPRGGQYRLVMADGSKIWLNAASSIRFPTAFPGSERRVEITGEAYFEIARDTAKPFTVVFTGPTGKTNEVRVLGTHFNIMAYSDEAAAKTTLLEGSIKINSGGKMALLKPGQQASLKEGDMKVVSGIDTDEVIAWKNGYFYFSSANLQEVMRQLARWYDVEVSYEGKIPVRRFGGKISRDNNASEVLKILELSKVKFRMENKKIVVTQ